MISASELRRKYLAFFASKGHTVISGAPLIPEHDPTVLFTTAGMHPLVPYLLGEKHPAGTHLVDAQKCVRTDDIEEVGDTTHHTFFEMLGNWSLGDYFKQDAIAWSWEFLTSQDWLGLDPSRLAVSVFAGDRDAPRDDEAVQVWREVSHKQLEGRIDYLPKAKNWWGPAGQTGPCGPDTEMFYWVGAAAAPKTIAPGDLATSSDWVEIWNDVFMQYNKTAAGVFEKLQKPNVDTGMGLERTVAVLNGLNDNYLTDLFQPIIRKIEELSEKKYGAGEETTRAMRIIADHMRAAAFILAEGLEPSNTERGYVLRRLIRRTVRYGKQLGMQEKFCSGVAQSVIAAYRETYPELEKQQLFILSQLDVEQERFEKTLQQGIARVTKYADDLRKNPADLDAFVFDMYQSYGFPLELTREELVRHSIQFVVEDLKEAFARKYKAHQDLSRTASAGVFKGGLQDHSEISTRYHTATHLLQAALRQVLGTHVFQKGSNITAERMRFDFPHPDQITPEQVRQIEGLVNQKIQEALPVSMEEMTVGEAKKQGALGVFEHTYGERVKVYSLGAFSKEICGGPHVANTSEVGKFTIQKVESIGQGVKRIRAVVQ